MSVRTASRPKSGPSPKTQLTHDLRAVGLKPTAVWPRLPVWWQDALAEEGGLFEVRAFIAKHFGLQLTGDGHLAPRPDPRVRFKSTAGVDPDRLDSARAAAVGIARAVAAAAIPDWAGALPAAGALRREILDQGRPWVGFEDLIEACWRRGVPVLYLPDLPVTGRKMHGLVTEVAGRPVIVIALHVERLHPAWASFILAHEMGHVALGHLDAAGDDTIVDGELTDGDDDPDEVAANGYALECLNGDRARQHLAPRPMTAEALAQAATQAGRRYAVDPGHLTLNWAHGRANETGTNPLAIANRANLRLGAEPGQVARLCRRHVQANLDRDRLPADTIDFLAAHGLIDTP
jgi:hypothetical protein